MLKYKIEIEREGHNYDGLLLRFREFERVVQDLVVHALHISVVERRQAGQHLTIIQVDVSNETA